MSNDAETLLPLAGAPRRLTTVKVHARGQDFRVVQVRGQLLVCAVENCCCGHTDKGRLPVNTDLYSREWEGRRLQHNVHLTMTGCLGPCIAGNNAMLVLFNQSFWFANLNDDALIPQIFDYIEAMIAEGKPLPAPDALIPHLYDRFLPSDFHPLASTQQAEEGGLDRLDPVCLMDVDPATAQWKTEYNGRTIYFCAPSCKKSFERDPSAYALA